MPIASFNFATSFWGQALAALGWVLLVVPATFWFAGQIGLSQKARRIGFFTPVIAAFVGGLILNQLRAWPF